MQFAESYQSHQSLKFTPMNLVMLEEPNDFIHCLLLLVPVHWHFEMLPFFVCQFLFLLNALKYECYSCEKNITFSWGSNVAINGHSMLIINWLKWFNGMIKYNQPQMCFLLIIKLFKTKILSIWNQTYLSDVGITNPGIIVIVLHVCYVQYIFRGHN